MAKPAPPSAYADKLRFDLNDSDRSDDELPTKFKRFDLNDSDFSDDESSTKQVVASGRPPRADGEASSAVR